MGTQYNVMVGSDSSVYFSREAKDQNGKMLDYITDANGNIKTEYPVLERRTGHSLKGTTESIESAEVRKGRTKSAPRKGNSSTEGSLDIELSPGTYDDIFEAALRGSWETWTSDYGDIFINKEGVTFSDNDGKFLTKNSSGVYDAKKLIGKKGSGALIESDACDFEISQLKVGTESHKFGAVVKYDGPDGALYQDFQHLAVNTMSLSVSPGQIVTGSFGFMGSNDPNLLGSGYKKATTYDSDAQYYTKDDRNGKFSTATVANQATFKASTYYTLDATENNFNKAMKDRFDTTKSESQVRQWIEDLSDVVENQKDQYTAREGFLIVNGKEVDYGSNLTFELNNGLKNLYAIFRPDAVSNPAMSLDVTGTLDAYLIKDHSEGLFNYSVNDTDVELVWSFQDKEENPEDIYVFQIFKTKFDKDVSSGSEELTVSLNYTSFEERAVRIFRLRKKTVSEIVLSNNPTSLQITLASEDIGGSAPGSVEKTDISAKLVDKNGLNMPLTWGNYNSGKVSYSFATLSKGKYTAIVEYKGVTYKKAWVIS